MELGEIFKDALKYPTTDYKSWLILGVVALVSSLVSVLAQWGVYNSSLSSIWIFVSILITILILGYCVSVVKNGVELNNEIPAFDWVKNLVDGFKYIGIVIVYYIIPTIIISIIGFATGYGPMVKIISIMSQSTAANATATPTLILNTVPQSVWSSLAGALAITSIVAIILYLIFSIFFLIAVCRFAKYDSFGEIFNFKAIYDDIKEIGILKIIVYLIFVGIIAFVIGIIIGFISFIPFIGVIIGVLFGTSFIYLFSNRALGLLYSDI